MTLDKRTLTKLSYNDLYYLFSIIDKRQAMLENSRYISNQIDKNYYSYLGNLKLELINYIDEKLKKIGKETENEEDNKKS